MPACLRLIGRIANDASAVVALAISAAQELKAEKRLSLPEKIGDAIQEPSW